MKYFIKGVFVIKKNGLNSFKSILHDYLIFNGINFLLVVVFFLYIPLMLLKKFYSDKPIHFFIDILDMFENNFSFKKLL